MKKKNGAEVTLHTINIKDVMNVMFRLFGATRCSLCYDALAEYADLSFGDFWAFDYQDQWAQQERCTLVYQRTARGKELIEKALADGAIEVSILPHERNSKRILKMARGKKNRAIARLFRRKMQARPYPDYHFQLYQPNREAKSAVLLYDFFKRFRGPLCRKLILRILFSPLGVFLDKVNTWRKNKFSDYHGN